VTSSISSGDIIEDYPYLWLRQRDRGEIEGRKARPVCVALAISDSKGMTHLALLPISGQPPGVDQRALELPPIEVRRAGLSEWKRAWVYISEYNYDIAERSFYLEPGADARKKLSSRFMALILREFRPSLAIPRARVNRR
jgi:hypothetical protein